MSEDTNQGPATPARVHCNDQLGPLPAGTLDAWRANYGLDKDPHELHDLWKSWAPPGAVLALRAAVHEIERLTCEIVALDYAEGQRVFSEREKWQMLCEQALAALVYEAGSEPGLYADQTRLAIDALRRQLGPCVHGMA